jgi:hypothetical protein
MRGNALVEGGCTASTAAVHDARRSWRPWCPDPRIHIVDGKIAETTFGGGAHANMVPHAEEAA